MLSQTTTFIESSLASAIVDEEKSAITSTEKAEPLAKETKEAELSIIRLRDENVDTMMSIINELKELLPDWMEPIAKQKASEQVDFLDERRVLRKAMSNYLNDLSVQLTKSTHETTELLDLRKKLAFIILKLRAKSKPFSMVYTGERHTATSESGQRHEFKAFMPKLIDEKSILEDLFTQLMEKAFLPTLQLKVPEDSKLRFNPEIDKPSKEREFANISLKELVFTLQEKTENEENVETEEKEEDKKSETIQKAVGVFAADFDFFQSMFNVNYPLPFQEWAAAHKEQLPGLQKLSDSLREAIILDDNEIEYKIQEIHIAFRATRKANNESVLIQPMEGMDKFASVLIAQKDMIHSLAAEWRKDHYAKFTKKVPFIGNHLATYAPFYSEVFAADSTWINKLKNEDFGPIKELINFFHQDEAEERNLSELKSIREHNIIKKFALLDAVRKACEQKDWNPLIEALCLGHSKFLHVNEELVDRLDALIVFTNEKIITQWQKIIPEEVDYAVKHIEKYAFLYAKFLAEPYWLPQKDLKKIPPKLREIRKDVSGLFQDLSRALEEQKLDIQEFIRDPRKIFTSKEPTRLLIGIPNKESNELLENYLSKMEVVSVSESHQTLFATSATTTATTTPSSESRVNSKPM